MRALVSGSPARPVLDRYVVGERIGEGGAGIVYRAFDTKLQRSVALKVMRGRSGSAEASHRALLEAQAIAQLQHPNVIAVHDVFSLAEVAEVDGSCTCIVMELLEGETLSAWLERARPSERSIIDVFLQAGRGLLAAHHRHLVHGDFKPANVMVGRDGRVRVADFGMASAIASPTEAASYGGTPQYMAPEQHRGAPASIASDQYAFALSLWEALEGRYPFAASDARGTRAAKLEGKLPPPLRLSRLRAQALRRALSPVPEQRYPSLEPLLARLTRWQRARRTMVSMVTIGAAVPLVGTAVSEGFEVYRAGTMRSRCEDEARSIEAMWNASTETEIAAAFDRTGVSYAEDSWQRAAARVDAFAEQWQRHRSEVCMSTTADPSDAMATRTCLDDQATMLAALVGEWTQADAEVVRRAVRAAWDLGDARSCDGETGHRRDPSSETTAGLRRRLAGATGVAAAGRSEAALGMVDDVLDEARSLGDPALLAAALHSRGMTLRRLGRYSDAAVALESAAREAEAVGDDLRVIRVANALTSIVGYDLGRPTDGLRWHTLAEAKRARVGLPEAHPAFADSLHAVGLVHYREGDYQRAAEVLDQALAIRARVLGETHPDLAGVYGNRGLVHEELGRFPEAFAAHERSLAMRRELLGPDHPDVGISLMNLGNVANRSGDYERSLDLHLRGLAILERALGSVHRDVADALNNLGLTYHGLGRYADAIATHERALSIREQVFGPHHPAIGDSLNNIAIVQDELGRSDLALPVYQRALEVFTRSLGAEHPTTVGALGNFAVALSEQGRDGEARAVFERVHAAYLSQFGPEHPGVAFALHNLASIHEDHGEYERALAMYEQALSIKERVLGAVHPSVADGLDAIGDVLHRQDRLADALGAHERALTIREASLGVEHAAVASSLASIAEIRLETGAPDRAASLVDRALRIHGGLEPHPVERARVRYIGARAWKALGEGGRANDEARLALRELPLGSQVELRREIEAFLRRSSG